MYDVEQCSWPLPLDVPSAVTTRGVSGHGDVSPGDQNQPWLRTSGVESAKEKASRGTQEGDGQADGVTNQELSAKTGSIAVHLEAGQSRRMQTQK